MNLISSYVCLKGQLGVAQLESEVKTKTTMYRKISIEWIFSKAKLWWPMPFNLYMIIYNKYSVVSFKNVMFATFIKLQSRAIH